MPPVEEPPGEVPEPALGFGHIWEWIQPAFAVEALASLYAFNVDSHQ